MTTHIVLCKQCEGEMGDTQLFPEEGSICTIYCCECCPDRDKLPCQKYLRNGMDE